MSTACASVRAGSRSMERLALLGMVCGALSFFSVLLCEPQPVAFAMTPQEFTAWAGALCGAATMLANTVYFIWHKVISSPKPKRKRKKRDDGDAPQAS